MKQIPIMVVAALWTVACSGCMQEVHLYPSPERTPFEVGVLKVKDRSVPNLKLEVDGKPVEWDRNGHSVRVHLLPGRHEIKWSRWTGDPSGSAIQWVPKEQLQNVLRATAQAGISYDGKGILDAKAGKIYEFHFAFLKGKEQQSGPSWRTPDGFAYLKSTEVKDTATWIEQFHVGLKPKVVVGKRPEWVDYHTCEICGKKKAAFPCEHGCPKCRVKEYGH